MQMRILFDIWMIVETISRLYGSCKPLISNLYICLHFLWMQQTTGTFYRTCLFFSRTFVFAIFTRNAAYHFLSYGYELAL